MVDDDLVIDEHGRNCEAKAAADLPYEAIPELQTTLGCVRADVRRITDVCSKSIVMMHIMCMVPPRFFPSIYGPSSPSDWISAVEVTATVKQTYSFW
mmetsp:Transcript_8073/g.18026  ORF Transcript_8073/g.18026 Transcript_8073/m.18026 type:complete len:97 (-) Transcript_8073:8-298(-)